MKQKKIIISSLMSLGIVTAFAQQKPTVADTTIKSTTIEISQIYQPKIKEAVKEQYNPTLPPANQRKPNFNYNVPEQVLHYSYKPTPLQPLAIGSDTVQKEFQHYIKAGIGNRRTLLLDAGLGGLKSKNFESNIHLGVLSQKGNLAYQKQTVAALNANSIYRKNGFYADINLDASHHNFFQYGYDEVAQPNKIATRQTLSGGGLSLRVLKSNNEYKFEPQAKANISFYTGNNISNESTGALELYASKRFRGSDWKMKAGVEALSTQLNSEFYCVSNSYASVNVGAEYDDKKLFLKAYLKPTIGQNSNSFLLQDIEAKYNFEKVQATVGAGTQGLLTQNTYKQLFLTNPYISLFPSQQTHSNEVYAFVEKGLGHHFSFTGKLSWWQYENLATFLNQPIANSEKMMVVYIPKVNAVSAQIGMRYQIANTISVGAQLSLFKYGNIGYNTKVWQTPTTKVNGDFIWNPLPELSLTAYSAYVAGSFALDNNLAVVKLKPFLDLGFGAEYLVLKKLSLFINCNNLLNNKYQRWQGYQAYGINIYGGVRLKF